MKIFIKKPDGTDHLLDINQNSKIVDVKRAIYRDLGVKICAQRLILGGKPLIDEKTLEDYSVHSNSIIFMLQRIKGGKPVIYLYP